MPGSRRTHLFSWAAVLTATALVLTGCSSSGSNDIEAHTLQAQSFPEVYAQTINWGSCETGFGQDNERLRNSYANSDRSLDEFECAMIDAPLDWNDADNSATIELAVTKLTAQSDEPLGTLFVNPGGPGESALSVAYSFPTWAEAKDIADAYDIIGIDPRGIGLSTPITCDSTSQVKEIVFASCAEEQPLANSMGTSQVARDHELMRTLVDDTKFNYLGYSYGTVLGATYATLFPETVGRMMLDGAINADWAMPVSTYEQLIAMNKETELLLAGCGTEYEVTQCPVHSLEELMTQQDGEVGPNGELTGLFTTDGRELGGYDLYQYLQAHLYGSPAYRLAGLNAVGAAFAGDQAAIDEIAGVVLAGGASVHLSGQFVICSSQQRDPNVLGLVDAITESGTPEIYGGDEGTDELVSVLLDSSCSALAEAGNEPTKFTGPEDTTIVVVSMTGDHATPYHSGERLAQDLANSSFVTVEGHGHAASFSGRSSCIDDLTVEFFVNGTVPADGTVCKAD